MSKQIEFVQLCFDFARIEKSGKNSLLAGLPGSEKIAHVFAFLEVLPQQNPKAR